MNRCYDASALRLRKHFRLTALLKFYNRGYLRDTNPEHLEAIRLKRSDVNMNCEMRYKTVSRNRLVNMEAVAIEQRCWRQILRMESRRRLELSAAWAWRGRDCIECRLAWRLREAQLRVYGRKFTVQS